MRVIWLKNDNCLLTMRVAGAIVEFMISSFPPLTPDFPALWLKSLRHGPQYCKARRTVRLPLSIIACLSIQDIQFSFPYPLQKYIPDCACQKFGDRERPPDQCAICLTIPDEYRKHPCQRQYDDELPQK